MIEIIHKLVIKTAPKSVFEAVRTTEGLNSWWVDDSFSVGKLNGKAQFKFHAPGVIFNMIISELEENKRLVWNCQGEMDEWKNTDISFDIKEHELGSLLTFKHSGWKTTDGDFGSCSFHWALYLKSLKSYLEDGTGNPTIN